MDYPDETEIRRLLRPYLWGLWVFAVAAICCGLWLEFNTTLPEPLVRSGNLTLLLVLLVYLHMENKEFLTGMPANFMDAEHHYRPRKIAGPTYLWLSLIGSLVSIFGDLPKPLMKCGALTC